MPIANQNGKIILKNTTGNKAYPPVNSTVNGGKKMNSYATKVFDQLKAQTPWESEFLQSVEEVFNSLGDVLDADPRYEAHGILERLVTPERIISFAVPWVDARGKIHVNHGYRIQFNSAIGPYKGGLRFHPSVNLSILKFLGFEQTFKNALTTLPMGGGKGGSDFDPKGKTEQEIMNFCKSFMRELYRHIGPDTDIPAGDIGVGAREIGFLFGEYKHLANRVCGVITGKGANWGGSLIRPEATGFGAIYFVRHMLAKNDEVIEGKRIAISGFGNVAWGVALKATQLGAKVVTLSGPDGFIYDEAGLDEQKIAFMLQLRASGNDVVAPYAEKFPESRFFAGRKPWEIPVDIAMPCATQNELQKSDADALIANKVRYVAEVSNMGCAAQAVGSFRQNGVVFAPGKAVNAGGVAVSCLEMSQNAGHVNFSADEVDRKLQEIMRNIHDNCVCNAGKTDGVIDYVTGANIAGFKRVADAMIAQGF